MLLHAYSNVNNSLTPIALIQNNNTTNNRPTLRIENRGTGNGIYAINYGSNTQAAGHFICRSGSAAVLGYGKGYNSTSGYGGVFGSDNYISLYVSPISPLGTPYPSVPTLFVQAGSGLAANFTGNIQVVSTLYKTPNSGQIKNSQSQTRLMHSEDTPEALFTDYGTGQLVNGVATINFDPAYANTINMSYAYHVFIQLEGPCAGGVYVTDKTATGFSVVQQDAVTSNASFSYRITGKRKYFETLRFATEAEGKAASESMLEQVWPEFIANRNQARQEIAENANSVNSEITPLPENVEETITDDPTPANNVIPAITPMTGRNYPVPPSPNISVPTQP